MPENKKQKCLLTRIGDRYPETEDMIKNCRCELRTVRHCFEQYMTLNKSVDKVGKIVNESGYKELWHPLEAFFQADVELISALMREINALFALIEELEKISSFHLKPDGEDIDYSEKGESN